MRLKKIYSVLTIATLSLSLISCAGARPDIKALTAERPKDEAFHKELKKELSSLNIVVETSTGDLSNNLNRLVAKELYKGGTKTSGVSATVLRNGPLVLNAADNYLYLTIPVSVTLSYGMFETPTIATKLKFKLAPRVTADWKVNADISYLGLSDQLVEEIGIGPLSVKPRSTVEGLMQPVQRLLSDLVNKKLNEQFPLKAEVAKVWNAAQKPILVDKGYSAWLTIAPQEVLLYPFYAQNSQIRMSVGLKSFTEIVVGPEPKPRQPIPLPNLKLVTGGDKAFRVAVNTDLYYKDIVTIASPLLLDKDFGSDGRSVVLKSFDLYGNGDRLIVKVQTAGSLEGTFYLTCRPAFNPQTNVFTVEDVDFDMETRSLLLTSADWFLHGTIRNTIHEKLNMDLTERLTQAKAMAGKSLAKVNLAENLFLTGSVKTIKLNDVMVQRDKLSIQVYTEGETAITLR